MKINAILTLVAATLVCKATADCFADKYGFPCCSETKDIVAIENNIKWGYENGIKCAIEPIIALKRRSNETCTPVPIGADYMQKLEITNLCPAEALTPQEGIEYPTAQKVTYYSQYAEKEKQMNVILPVGYTEEKKYPVLYLLHGFMGDEDTLLQSNVGVDTIPAYLHSLGKAKEMIVVLPDEYTPPPGKEVEPDLTSKEYTAGYDTFINDLVESIMPYMEEHYSIATGKENTAIGGFSMGGRNSLYIGIKRPDLFGYVGGFAPAPGIVPADDWTGHHDGLITEEEFGYENKAPYVTLINVGTVDSAVGSFPKEYHELLERHGNRNIYFEVPGANHDDTAVAAGFYNFVQTAFGALNPEPACDPESGECTPVPIGADYMQKLDITSLCPAEALTPQEGIEYPTAQKVTYYSQYAEKEKQMNVILPVGYTEEKKYPVLYLLHGFMGDEDTLLQSNVGAATIPAYLYNQQKAKEMIVVLPDEYTPPPGKEVEPELTSKEYTAGYDTFINDLVESIMPYMKEHYSIATGKENTAIAGFSMGGRNSLYIGVKRPDLFGYVGAFAPAPGIVPADDWTGHHDGLMSVEEFGYENKAPFVTLIDVGTADKAVGTFPKEYHELFERNGNNNIYFEVPGADHNDTAVAAGLYNFVQTAFGALNPEPECTSVNEEQEQNEVDSNPEVELSEEEEQEQGEEQGNVDPKNPYVVYVTKTKVVTKTAKATKTVKVTKTAKVTLTKTAVKTLKTKKTKKVVKTVSKSFNTEN